MITKISAQRELSTASSHRTLGLSFREGMSRCHLSNVWAKSIVAFEWV